MSSLILKTIREDTSKDSEKMSQAVMAIKDWEKGMKPPRADPNVFHQLDGCFRRSMMVRRAIWTSRAQKTTFQGVEELPFG